MARTILWGTGKVPKVRVPWKALGSLALVVVVGVATDGVGDLVLGAAAADTAAGAGAGTEAAEAAAAAPKPFPKISDYISNDLKEACSDAFKNNSLLSKISEEDRELAAKAYENMADGMQGAKADLARLYNLERAKFLRGEVDGIAGTANTFGDQIGFGQ